MKTTDKIYIAGHTGLVGSSIFRLLKKNGYTNILTISREKLDLTQQSHVNSWFEKNKPDYVFLAAAKVGGINYNKNFPADFIYENLIIQTNVIHASYINNVKKLLYLGSSCIYPKENPFSIKEERLLTGLLEPTNEAYAIAKIAGLKMCEYYNIQYNCNFVSVMPCNLYGPNDCFNIEKCHVIPALIKKFHIAKQNTDTEITIWGNGLAKREFLYVDDLANALYVIMQSYNNTEFINIGYGEEIGVQDLFYIISKIVGYKGNFVFDKSKPDGMLSRMLDSTKIKKMGWTPKIDIETGIKTTYDWFLKNYESCKKK